MSLSKKFAEKYWPLVLSVILAVPLVSISNNYGTVEVNWTFIQLGGNTNLNLTTKQKAHYIKEHPEYKKKNVAVEYVARNGQFGSQ